jgi:hypothetical protein
VRKRLQFTLILLVVTLFTAIVSSHFAAKHTKAAYVATVYNVEAFNELHRIESWDNLEQLLLKGCNKEALEYVRMEQSLGLSSLQWNLNNGAKLEKKVEEENRSILSRAQSFESKGKYDIPTCK